MDALKQYHCKKLIYWTTRIAEVDQEAATWFSHLVTKYIKGEEAFDNFKPTARDLNFTFTWEDTPQGDRFWRNLHHNIFEPSGIYSIDFSDFDITDLLTKRESE